jgi:nitrile hydratase
MTRVHDMGGRFGDGPVDARPEPIFAADWHARALGVTLALGAHGKWNIDASRFARECLAPKDYTRFSYYEKWISALANLAVTHGMITRDDLANGVAAQATPLPATLKPADVAATLAKGGPSARPGAAPALAVGDHVRARHPARNALAPGGHTRLPAYAAGHVGRVIARRGAHVLPDSNAHFLGEAPEPLYTIAFDAADLWGAAECAGDDVTLDLWESYLEPCA